MSAGFGATKCEKEEWKFGTISHLFKGELVHIIKTESLWNSKSFRILSDLVSSASASPQHRAQRAQGHHTAKRWLLARDSKSELSTVTEHILKCIEMYRITAV